MFGRELALMLQQWGVGTFTTSDESQRSIWWGEIPQGITEGLYMVAAASPPPHQYVDTEYPVIDFWYRSPSTAKAEEKMRLVFNLLHRRQNWQTANWHIYFSQALGAIVDVDRDDEGGKLLRLSVQFICRNLNNVS